MRGKLWFLSGMAAGFVLGARAGREKYEELVLKGRKVLDHPTVQEAAGVAQAQANRLYSEGKDKLSHTKIGEKLSTGNGSTGQLTSSSDTLAPSSTSGGTTSSTSSSRTTPSGTTGSNSSTF